MTAMASNLLPGPVAMVLAIASQKTPLNTGVLIKISLKMIGIINLLASLYCAVKLRRPRETLDAVTVSSAPVTPLICCRYVIKGKFFHDDTHLCKKNLPSNACKYCTSQHTRCKAVCNPSLF